MNVDRNTADVDSRDGMSGPVLVRANNDSDERTDQLTEDLWELQEGVTRIGRSKRNDLSIDDTSVSRFQCCLLRDGDEVRIFDARSRNATRVGKVPARGQRLENGDTLKLGRCCFTFVTPILEAGQRCVESQVSLPDRQAAEWRRSKSASFAPVAAILLFTGAAAGWFLYSSLSGGGTAPDAASTPAGGSIGSSDADGVAAELRQALNKQQHEIAMLTRQLAEALQATSVDSHAEIVESAETEPLEVEPSEAKAIRAELARLESARKTFAKKHRQALLGTHTFDPRAVDQDAVDQDAVDQIEWHPILQTPNGTASKPVAEVTRKRLASAEVHALVEELIATLDRFGEGIVPAELEPALTTLSSGIGRKPAESVLLAYRHGHGLDQELVRRIQFLRKRTQRLLKLAERASPDSKQGSGSRKKGSRTKPASRPARGSANKSTAELEEYQRQLELSEKKIAVQEQQRASLTALCGAILDSLARFRDADATKYLSEQFGLRSDKLLRLAILRALDRSRAVAAIPVLIPRLRSRDDEVAAAVHKTLVSLSGEDFAKDRGAWSAWWSEKKSLLAPDPQR